MGDAPAPLQTTLAAQPKEVGVPLWVRASWFAPIVGIAGNMFVTTGITSHLKGASFGHLVGVLLSVFWSLFIAAGLLLGIASLIGAAIRRRPRWALHGGIGVALGSLLIVWGVAAVIASRGRPHLDAGAAPTRPSDSQPPTVPDGAILRPVFTLPDGRLEAGTAFSVMLEKPLIVTALHLFGPDGGLREKLSPLALPKAVKEVELSDAFTKAPITKTGPAVCLPNAAMVPAINRDVAAFTVDSDSARGLKFLELRRGLPGKGERVWLAASVAGGAPPEKRLHAGTVVIASEEMLAFEYDNPSLDLRATSGAPILDAAGRVVGVNISLARKDGALVGLANPSIGFAKMLVDAVEGRTECP